MRPSLESLNVPPPTVASMVTTNESMGIPDFEAIPHELSNRVHALKAAALWLSGPGGGSTPYQVVEAARVFERFLNGD